MIMNKKCPQCIDNKINESFYRHNQKHLNNYWIRFHLSKHTPSVLYDYIQYISFCIYLCLQFNATDTYHKSEHIM